MTTGYICDRCGETFTGGGNWLYSGCSGSHAVMQTWDLCPDCMTGFTDWMDGGQESQDVTGDVERVTETPEMLHERIAELGDQVDALTAERGTLQGALDIAVQNESALEAERDQWRDAYGDSERLRLELVEELEKRDKGIRRLKQRRGELIEQVRQLQDDAARERREA